MFRDRNTRKRNRVIVPVGLTIFCLLTVLSLGFLEFVIVEAGILTVVLPIVRVAVKDCPLII